MWNGGWRNSQTGQLGLCHDNGANTTWHYGLAKCPKQDPLSLCHTKKLNDSFFELKIEKPEGEDAVIPKDYFCKWNITSPKYGLAPREKIDWQVRIVRKFGQVPV